MVKLPDDVNDAYVGTSIVNAIYLGSYEVWNRTPLEGPPFFYAQARDPDDLNAQTRIVKFDLSGNMKDLFVPPTSARRPSNGPATYNYVRPVVSVNGDIIFYETDNPLDSDSPLFPFSQPYMRINGKLVSTPRAGLVPNYFGHAEWSPDGTMVVQAAVWDGGSDWHVEIYKPTYVSGPDAYSYTFVDRYTAKSAEPSWGDDGITFVEIFDETDARPMSTQQNISGYFLTSDWGPIDDGVHVFDPYRNGNLVIWLVVDGLSSGIRIHNIAENETEWLIPPDSRPGRVSQARWVPGMADHIVLCEQNDDPNTFWSAWLFDINDIENPTRLTDYEHGSIEQVFPSVV